MYTDGTLQQLLLLLISTTALQNCWLRSEQQVMCVHSVLIEQCPKRLCVALALTCFK